MRYCQSILLHLCLLLLSNGLHSQVPRSQADELLQLIALSKVDSNRVRLYLQLGAYYLHKRGSIQTDMDSALSYAMKAEDLSRKLSFDQGFGDSQKLLARVYIQSKQVGKLRALGKTMRVDKHKAEVLQRTGRFYLQKHYELPVDLDSATYFAKAALNLQLQLKDSLGHARSLIMLAHINNERGNLTMKRFYQQKAVPLIERVKDKSVRARLWFDLGSSYTRSEEAMPERMNLYRKSLALYRQLGNKEREAFMLKRIADMHQYQGKYTQSLRELLDALRIQKSIDFVELHYTYDLLAHVYTRMGNYEMAMPYALDAVRNARETADTIDLDLFLSRIGQIHMDLGQHVKALEVHRTILNKLTREPDNLRSQFRFVYIRKMSQSLIALKRQQECLTLIENFLEKDSPIYLLEGIIADLYQGEAYMSLQDYARAEKNLTAGLAKAKAAKGAAGWSNFYDIIPEIMLFHAKLTDLYSATGQLKKASFHLNEHFNMLNKEHDLLQLSNLHLQAFKLDSLNGDLPMAISHYQQYKALQDSVFNERKSNQLIAYQVQYETERKEQELLLKEKDIELKEQNIQVLKKERLVQQDKIKQANLIRNGIVVGATMLLLLLGVIYNRFLLKRKSNRLLKIQQANLFAQQQQIKKNNLELEQLLSEKELLLKEVHHRVKNNLQVVISLLNSQVEALEDNAALAAIHDSQNRVQAIALIHQKLYKDSDVSLMSMDSYIAELISYFMDSFDVEYISFDLEMDRVLLDVNKSVPIGLILNEAITNALKYAYAPNTRGKIFIGMKNMDDQTVILTIKDEGRGLPFDFDLENSQSLGMSLIKGLTQQLNGRMSIASTEGVKIVIEIPLETERLNTMVS